MKKMTDQPLTKLADAAFKQAARKVIERASQFGTPVIVWENGGIRRMTVVGGRLKPEDQSEKGDG